MEQDILKIIKETKPLNYYVLGSNPEILDSYNIILQTVDGEPRYILTTSDYGKTYHWCDLNDGQVFNTVFASKEAAIQEYNTEYVEAEYFAFASGYQLFRYISEWLQGGKR